jgi:hypothetical protein
VAGIDAARGDDGRPDLRTSRLSRIAWGLLQVLSLWMIARCLRRWLPESDPPGRCQWLFLLTLVVCGRFVLRDTHGGGGNLINVALCLLAFRDAELQRPCRAGLWFGLSLATKPALIWLLPVLWLFGHRRASLATMGWGFAAALLSWLMLHCDAGPWLRWIEGTFRFSTQTDAFAEPALGFPDFTWMNHALRCALARYLGTVPASQAGEIPGFFPGLELSVGTVAWVNRLCSLALLAALFVAARRARSDPAARPRVVAAGLVVTLLLSPLSWTGHHVALLPAWFLLLQHGFATRARWVVVLAVVCIPAWALGEEIGGKTLKNVLQSLYVMTAMDLALLPALLRVGREQRAAAIP